MTRLRAAYDALWATSPIAAPPEALVKTIQTGDRLSYHPETAAQELAGLQAAVKQAKAEVSALNGRFAALVAERSKPTANATADEVALQNLKRGSAMAKALAQMEELSR